MFALATSIGASSQHIALKTNLAHWGTASPNLSAEFVFNENISLDFGVTANPFDFDRFKTRFYLIQPEVRYWFKTKKPWHGHYIGLFGGQGWYDLENGGRGYRGEGQMAALSYGYMFPVAKHLSFDAEIGLGYMHTRFQEYLPIDGHYVYQQTSKINYFGPLKLKFSLVWRFWPDKRKGGVKYDY